MLVAKSGVSLLYSQQFRRNCEQFVDTFTTCAIATIHLPAKLPIFEKALAPVDDVRTSLQSAYKRLLRDEKQKR